MLKNTIALTAILALPLTMACGDDDDNNNNNNIDAAVAVPDAMVEIDSGVQATAGCMAYCTNAMTNCNGDPDDETVPTLFPGMPQCLAACTAMPEGTPADQSGNTAWCRAYHAGDPAAGAPATHCPHASAGSDQGVCGATCDAYCDQVMANCEAGGLYEQYADRPACMTACGEITLTGSFDDTGFNTVQCRVYHGSFPAEGGPEIHCSHAGPTGDGVCVGDPPV